jgi:hypothetical protein
MFNEVIRNHEEQRESAVKYFDIKETLDETLREKNHSNTIDTDQETVNNIFKNIDDMFLRLFCVGTDKAEIERFKQKSLSSIIEIRKNLARLGLKYIEEY